MYPQCSNTFDISCRNEVSILAVEMSPVKYKHFAGKYLVQCLQMFMKWFSCHPTQVAITPNNVRWLRVFEDDQSEFSVLALHPPDHLTQGLELHTHICTKTL